MGRILKSPNLPTADITLKNVKEISDESPYFYMLLDYGDLYLCLRSNRNSYALDFVKHIAKDEIDPLQAKVMLEEGERFFKHCDDAVDKLLKKYDIE